MKEFFIMVYVLFDSDYASTESKIDKYDLKHRRWHGHQFWRTWENIEEKEKGPKWRSRTSEKLTNIKSRVKGRSNEVMQGAENNLC